MEIQTQSIKKINKLSRINNKLEELLQRAEESAEDSIWASIITLLLTGFVSAYLVVSFPGLKHLGELIGLYAIFNMVLLIRYIVHILFEDWTVNEIGNMIHNFIETWKGRQ